ncbi:MAG: hypothetical protein WCG98_04420 [bacterium]
MINVVHKDGFVIDHKLFYGYQTPNKKYINLAQSMGDDMRYEKLDYQLIDYPGEYDVQDISIECFLGADQKLNYIITLPGKRVGIIQSPDVLELDEVGNVNFRLYTEDKILNKIDQLELEGERQKLEIVE